eukprot:5901808-Amphidinium_carterae.1
MSNGVLPIMRFKLQFSSIILIIPMFSPSYELQSSQNFSFGMGMKTWDGLPMMSILGNNTLGWVGTDAKFGNDNLGWVGTDAKF